MNTTTDVTWNRLRKLIKDRDKSTCFHCGKVDENGHCDHLIPLSKGGTDSILNLVWSCEECNLKKSNKLIELGLEPDNIPPRQHQKIIKPNLDNIFPAIITWLIPPLPEYTEYRDFLSYFNFIIIIREMSFYSWLHDTIWPISDSTKLVLDAVEKFKIRREIIKSIKPTDEKDMKCPVCECPIHSKYETKNGILLLKWLCPAGHYGDSKSMTTDEVIEEEKRKIARKLYLKLEPWMPDFLLDF